MASKDVWVDLMAGTSAGVAQLLVGHPFDTIKVRMQAAGPGNHLSAVAATRQIVLSHGVLRLYKGMGAPLATVAAFNAVLFSSWGALERVILGPEGGTMTAGQAALAGSLAGIPGCFLAAPTERIKCRLQAQAGRQPSLGQVFGAADYRAGRQLFRGPMDVLRSTVKYEGPLGVMRGLVPTMLREVPGNGAYFAGYELTKQWMARSQGLASPTDLGAGSLMLAGGVGGASFWAFVYPMDVIKTRLQTQNVFNPQYSGILDCTRKLLAEGGWRSLFRGFGPCMLRSFPANSAAFTAYELVKAQLAGRS